MGKNAVFLLSILFVVISCKDQGSMIDKTVVDKLDIERYLGRWYEISRFNHRFERGLVGVTASYSYGKDGRLIVENAGFKETLDGKKSSVIGKAKIPDPNIPSKLKVSFFWFFYSDYYVLEVDEDYQWAVVGTNSDKYLWILSRKPQMDESIYNELLNRLSDRGYDVSKLIKVEQLGR